MAGALKPILKGVYVCDDVIGNPVGGKPIVVNLWDTVWVPSTEPFPFQLGKLCAFAWLRGGRGRVTFRVDIVSARTGEVVGRTPHRELDLANPNRSFYVKFLIPDFPFPEAGVYFVELFCDNEFLDDQPIHVRVRAEDGL
jgi:hypothetical protein